MLIRSYILASKQRTRSDGEISVRTTQLQVVCHLDQLARVAPSQFQTPGCTPETTYIVLEKHVHHQQLLNGYGLEACVYSQRRQQCPKQAKDLELFQHMEPML